MLTETDGQASGAESITQCSNHEDDWCCNADAQHVNCCQESPVARPFFALQDGQSYATIGVDQASFVPTLSTVTGIATSKTTGNDVETSHIRTSDQLSTSSRPSSRRPSTTSTTSTTQTQMESGFTKILSGSISIKTVVIDSVPTTSSYSTPDSSDHIPSNGSSGSHKTGLIAGCVVGVLLGLVVIGILIRILYRQRQQKSHPYSQTVELEGDGTAGTGARKSKGNFDSIAELDGRPFSLGRSISTTKGFIELESGTQFQSGAPVFYGPHTVGIGGGTHFDESKFGSAPPRYTPGINRSAHNHHNLGVAELDGTPAMAYLGPKTGVQQRNTGSSFKAHV